MVEGEGEEGVAGKDGDVDAEEGVVGGEAAAGGGGVEGWEVVVDEGGGVDHLEGDGGGEGGGAEAGPAEELAGSDAHDGRGPLGTRGENGVAHGVEDGLRVADGDGGVEVGVDLGQESRPVGLEIEG